MIAIIKTKIKDLLIIEPAIFADDRGYFFEAYNKKEFEDKGLVYRFVQDNESKSKKGVLRGLHFQKKYPQTKLIKVVEGEVFDVAVDLRKNSKTYGQWYGTILSDINKRMVLIPKGFAHGFLVLSDYAVFNYKCDEYYHPEDEGGILWNDPDIGVEWPIKDGIILSDKDKKNPLLKECKMEFDL